MRVLRALSDLFLAAAILFVCVVVAICFVGSVLTAIAWVWQWIF